MGKKEWSRTQGGLKRKGIGVEKEWERNQDVLKGKRIGVGKEWGRIRRA